MMSYILDIYRHLCYTIVLTTTLIQLTRTNVLLTEKEHISYCQSDSFVAKCRRNEFIVMTTAVYGRMELGKCVKQDFGYLGCSMNVLDVADRNCSGRQNCTIRVSNTDMDRVVERTCNMDLARYLVADYRCEKALVVIQPCHKPTSIHVQSGHITSDIVARTGCGNSTSPWILNAQPGQSLKFTLLDFSWTVSGKGQHGGDPVHQNNKRGQMKQGRGKNCQLRYGYMVDLTTQQMVEICGGGERYTDIYQSTGSVVQLVLEQDMVKKHSYVLRYRAIGCPDLVEPSDALLHRNGDTTVVECHSRKQQWHLKCVDTKWVGVIGNCTQQAAAIGRLAKSRDGSFGIPHGVAIVIVIAISLIISGGIICIGTLCSHRYSTPKQLIIPRVDREATYKQQQQQIYPPHNQQPNTQCTNPNLHRNEYMHIWEHPLPEPFIEEYQLPLQNNNPPSDTSHDLLLTKMKNIQEEMSRGLEKCVNISGVPRDEHVTGNEGLSGTRLLTMENSSVNQNT